MSEQIEGRNAVLEAFRSGKCVDKLFILDGCQDGPVRTIAREARKTDTIINYVSKERLDQLSETRAHQAQLQKTITKHADVTFMQMKSLFLTEQRVIPETSRRSLAQTTKWQSATRFTLFM